MGLFSAIVGFFKSIGTAWKAASTLQKISYVFQAITAVVGVKGFLQARNMQAKGQDILANKTSAGGKIPVIYGIRRVGAQIIYMDVNNNDSRDLYVVYALAVGEVDEILGRTIELDGNKLTDSSRFRDGGYIGSDKISSGSGSLNTVSQNGTGINAGAGRFGTSPTSKYRYVMNLHHGAATQTADPMLVASMSNWTSAHKLNGVAYIAAHFGYDKEGMWSGVPQLTVQVQGKKVYNPNKDSTIGGTGSHRFNNPSTYEWSDNPALCFLDYITNNEYGKGLTQSQINMSTFGSAANTAETLVNNPYFGNTEQTFLWQGEQGDDFISIPAGSGNGIRWWQNKIGERFTLKDSNGNIVLNNVKIKDVDRNRYYGEGTFLEIYFRGELTQDYSLQSNGTSLVQAIRFHCNGYLDTNKNVMENAKELLANMRGIFLYVNGKYELSIEDTGTSTFSITDDHIISDAGISVDYGNKDKKANKVIVEFFNANKKYELDTATVLHDATPNYYSDDNDEILEIKAEFPYVTDPYVAYNMAKAILVRSRNQTTMQFLGTPEMYKLNVGDIVDLTYTGLGFSGKVCRVEALELQPNGLIAVSLIEYFDVYTWEVPPQEPFEELANLPSAYAVKAPTGLTFTDSSSSSTGRPILSWDAPTDYPDYEFRVNVVDSSGNQLMNRIVNTTFAELNFTPTGSNYVASVTSLNTSGTESDPETETFSVSDEPVGLGDIRADAVTANTIDVNELSAISANLGAIDAGSIDIGSGNFTVSTAGFMTATGADISGDLSATTLDVVEANIQNLTLTLGGGILQDGSGNNLTVTNVINPDFPVDGLLHYFPLNGFSDPNDTTPADVVDVVSNVTGVITGSNGSFSTDSPNGQSYVNGATTGITLLSDAQADTWQSTTGDYTVALWFKSTSESGEAVARIITRDASDFWSLVIDQDEPNNQTIGLYTDGDLLTWDGASVNEWHHLALVVNGTTSAKVYVDGILRITDTNIAYTTASRPVVLGCNTESTISNTIHVFLGKLSDVRFYTKAITDKQVQSLYMNPAGGLPAKIEGDLFVTNSITSDKLIVNDLSSISANLGSITAGDIDIGSGAFSVTSAGVLDATGAIISGSFSSGTGNSIFKADTDGIYLGNATFGSAPFRVSTGGALTATSGTIGGVTLATNKIHLGTGTFNNSNTPFYVDTAGQFSLKDKLSFNGADLVINGKINAPILSASGQAGLYSLIPTSITGGSDDPQPVISADTDTDLGTVILATGDPYDSSLWTSGSPDTNATGLWLGGSGTIYMLGTGQSFRNSPISSGINSLGTNANGWKALFLHSHSSYSDTTNALYSIGGSLYFNGSQLGTGSGDITGVTITTTGGSLTGGAAFTSGAATFTLDIGSTITGAKTFDNNVVIQGDLDVQGTTTTIDTTNLDVKDKNITLNYSTGDSSANANGAGITIQDAVSAGNDATFTWNNSTDRFELSHGLDLPDSAILRFGDGADLRIQHNGTNSFIDNENGGLLIRNKSNDKDVDIQSDDGAGGLTNYFRADGSTGSAILYNYGDTKLATSSSGIDVTGNISVTGTVDGRDIATDGTKLDGIEAGATTDQTQAEINALGITAIGLSGTPNITVGTINSGAITSTGNSQFDGNLQVGDTVNQNSYGLLQVNQEANNDESGIGILSSGHARSMRIWVDESNSYINSGNGGAANLIFNEAITVSSGGNLTGVGTISSGDITASGSSGAVITAEHNGGGLANDAFIGGFIFKNNDTSGTEPHYAGITARAVSTFGAMALEFFADRDDYENDTPALTLSSVGTSGTTNNLSFQNITAITGVTTISSGAISSTGSSNFGETGSGAFKVNIHTTGNSDAIAIYATSTTGTTDQSAIRWLADNSIKAQVGLAVDSGRILSGTSADDFAIKSWGNIRFGNNLGTNTFTFTSTGNFQVNGQTVIDSSRFLQNVTLKIGTTGARFQGNGWHYDTNNDARFYFESSNRTFYRADGGHHFRANGDTTRLTISQSGGINLFSGGDTQVGSTVAIGVAGQTVLDSSRNLTNIGTISSGAITSSGASTFSSNVNIDGELRLDSRGDGGTGDNVLAFKDSGGDYSIRHNVNDGNGNYSISLGYSGVGNGRYEVTGDGVGKLLFGGHGRDGAISLNSAPTGTAGNDISFSIGLLVDGSDNTIRVGASANGTGMDTGAGTKVFDASGNAFATSYSVGSTTVINSSGQIIGDIITQNIDMSTGNNRVTFDGDTSTGLFYDEGEPEFLLKGSTSTPLYVQGLGIRSGTTNTDIIDDSRNLTNIATVSCGTITLTNTSHLQAYTTGGDTGTGGVDLPRGGHITFYGNNANNHSIGSRNHVGNITDDLRISSYGALYIDLDSNSNNSSAADFVIGRHGSGTGTMSTLVTISGEDGSYTSSGTISSGAITSTGASSFTDLAIGGAADSNYDLKVYGLARFEGTANFVSSGNAIQVGGTTIVDASRNLTNIAKITGNSSSGGTTTFNVGRGDVYFENNSGSNQNGAGITLRTSTNPSTGSIFDIRSSGQAVRFFVGQDLSSMGRNPFYVGGSAAESALATASSYTIELSSAGNITAEGNVTAYGSISDIRQKENIEQIDKPIERLEKIKGITFNYKKKSEDERLMGVIAQELLEDDILKLAVYEQEDFKAEDDDPLKNTYGVRYEHLTAILIEAIKEQQQQIDELKARLDNDSSK